MLSIEKKGNSLFVKHNRKNKYLKSIRDGLPVHFNNMIQANHIIQNYYKNKTLQKLYKF
jgi:hypothetical protein